MEVLSTRLHSPRNLIGGLKWAENLKSKRAEVSFEFRIFDWSFVELYILPKKYWFGSASLWPIIRISSKQSLPCFEKNLAVPKTEQASSYSWQRSIVKANILELHYIRSTKIMATGLRVSNNALNQNEKSKLTKRGQNENAESKKNESLPAKRAALGTLSSNTIRIQPFRAAKVHAALVFNHRYSFNDIHNHILYCVKRVLQLSQNSGVSDFV